MKEAPPQSHPILLNRRSFIKVGGLGAATLLLSQNASAHSNRAGRTVPGKRRLVVLELCGGNDGLNMVPPYGDGGYRDARRELAIDEALMHRLTRERGLHPSLSRLKARYDAGEVAVIQGVGDPRPVLSHQLMADRWHAGDLQGSAQTGNTGWLGRLLDELGDPGSPQAGLSLATSGWSVMNGGRQVVAADPPESSWKEIPAAIETTFHASLAALGEPEKGEPGLRASARAGLRDALALSAFRDRLPPTNPAYPQTAAGALLSLAAQSLKASEELRVVHIPLPFDCDTHAHQSVRQAIYLKELDEVLDVFFRDIAGLDHRSRPLAGESLAESTLVFWTTEFGRGLRVNSTGGTDHGGANTLFVVGAQIRGDIYGEAPSLSSLDAGNLKATMSFHHLLATITEGWMGVPGIIRGGQPLKIFQG